MFGGAVDDDDGDDKTDVTVDDATYFEPLAERFAEQMPRLSAFEASHERPSLCCTSGTAWVHGDQSEIVTYLSSLERDGTSFILLKPTEAVPHGGGLVLSEGSAEYNMLAQFAEAPASRSFAIPNRRSRPTRSPA